MILWCGIDEFVISFFTEESIFKGNLFAGDDEKQRLCDYARWAPTSYKFGYFSIYRGEKKPGKPFIFGNFFRGPMSLHA